MNIERVTMLSLRLNQLMADPHPGLSTWHAVVRGVIRELSKAMPEKEQTAAPTMIAPQDKHDYVAGVCNHTWPGTGPAPKYWWCCGVKVYRDYESYVDD